MTAQDVIVAANGRLVLLNRQPRQAARDSRHPRDLFGMPGGRHMPRGRLVKINGCRHRASS